MVTETASAAAAVAAEKTAEGYKDASAGIDNMMNALIDKAALVTKHWKLRPEESAPPFYLTVRHYSMTKMYILSISGLLVLVNSKVVYRHTDPIEDKLEVPFTLSGKTGKLVIETTPESKEKKNKVYTYTLFYGSDERRADFLTDGTGEEYPDLATKTSVTAGPARDVDGLKVQFYTLNVDGRAIDKRFKEFDTIHRLLRSAYAEAPELLAKLPKLPAKTWTRTKDEEFVEKRRAGLEELLQGILRVEHMTSNPDLLFFLNLLSDMPAGGGGGGGAAKMPPSSAPKAAPAELAGGGAAAPPEPAPALDDDDDDDDAL